MKTTIKEQDWIDFAKKPKVDNMGEKTPPLVFKPHRESDWAVTVSLGDKKITKAGETCKVTSALSYQGRPVAELTGLPGYIATCEEAKRLHDRGYVPGFSEGGKLALDVGLKAFFSGRRKDLHKGGDGEHFAQLGIWVHREACLLYTPPEWLDKWLEVRKNTPVERVLLWPVPGVDGLCVVGTDAARIAPKKDEKIVVQGVSCAVPGAETIKKNSRYTFVEASAEVAS